jgi:hypothetical protein
VNIKGHDNPPHFNPEHRVQYDTAYEITSAVFMILRNFEQSEEENHMLTMAAKAADVIEEIFPYEPKSTLIEKVEPMFSLNTSPTITSLFETCFLLNSEAVRNLPYEQRFCHLLRAGVDEA